MAVQILSLLIALYVAFRLLKPNTTQRRSPLILLSLLWLGSAYFWHYRIFAEINFLAPAYAILTGIQAITIAIIACLAPSVRLVKQNKIAAGILISIAIIWPAIDLLTGSGWPFIRVAGLHLIPLLFLTQASLLRLSPKIALWLIPIPLLLSIVCAYDAFVLNIFQDWLPLLTSCYTIILLVSQALKTDTHEH